MPRKPHTSPQTLRVLATLLADAQGWHYGYAIGKQTGLTSGTLYPILHRMTGRGLLEARWEGPAHPGRPARHSYRLTEAGLSHARAWSSTNSALPEFETT
jgi:DNA-binding PadR family transcriptional regulator